jgi:parallel beta-helix repeat protein
MRRMIVLTNPRHVTGIVLSAAAAFGFVRAVAVGPQPDVPVLEITADTTLEPAKTYGRLVIKASNVMVDGKGARIVGSAGDPKSFTGTGVSAAGVSNVTLKNLTVRGFETGLRVENGRGWTIQDCDFSDNFDDPSFGWGQLSRRGGIVLVGISGSTIRHCRGNRNWAGCVLERSNDNRLEDNDFSRCSEACLEMWQASRNTIARNKLDYGNRAKPEEVHARDSCCVLIESGSDGNTFADNSCTHGGDGIFLRALNGWVSTGNRFLRNDCSFGHNHGFECWCPDNYFEGNKANHCSYGFWMGGSDRTVMLNNEASFNGDPKGNHYSPHLPDKGHAGIVFMHGSGTHIVLRGNRCVGNTGAGIALIGDKAGKGAKWKAHHWVIDSNVLTRNRWGVYAQYADWINLDGNTIENNTAGNVVPDGGVTNLVERPADSRITQPPWVKADGPTVVRVGERVSFDASKSTDPAGRPLSFRWRLSDGTTAEAPRIDHTFSAAGFFRVGVTATNGGLSDLGSCDVFVVNDGPELGTEATANCWDWVDPQSKVRFADDHAVKLVGRSSLRADVGPYGGGRVWLRYALAAQEVVDPSKKSRLEFFIRAENQNIPCWQDENPIVALSGPDGTTRRLRPRAELLNTAEHPEARAGWLLVGMPLAGDVTWVADGPMPRTIDRVSLGFDSWGGKPFRIWLDGMRFE